MSEVAIPLHFELRLPALPLAVPACRALVRLFDEWLPPQLVDDAELIMSEVVSNAVRHGSPKPECKVELDIVVDGVRRALTCRVRDVGQPFAPPERPTAPEVPGGFGLFIAKQLATSLSISRVRGGNEVCFTVGSTA